jgi:hypothetical protein
MTGAAFLELEARLHFPVVVAAQLVGAVAVLLALAIIPLAVAAR